MLYFIFCLCCITLNIYAVDMQNAHIVYKTVKMDCLPSPKYVSNATCSIKAVNWQKSFANMDCDLKRQLRNISLHFSIFYKNDANNYNPFLVNVTQNICSILDRRTFSVYPTIVINILRGVSNVNHSCPFAGHLRVKDLFLDAKYLPVSAPIGEYKTVFTFLEGYPYDHIGTVILYIQATEERKFRGRKQRGG